MLVFNIVNSKRDKILGSLGINLTILRPGLRAVPLLGGESMSFGKGSFLLINCKILDKSHNKFNY
jgi:hypothetical protein